MQDDIKPSNKGLPTRKPKIVEPISQSTEAPLHAITEEPTLEDDGFTDEETTTNDPPTADETTATTTDDSTAAEGDDDASDTPKKRLPISWPPSKKEWAIIAAVILLLGGAGAAVWSMTHRSVKPVANHIVKKVVPKPVAPTTVPSTLSGLQVAPDVNDRPVTGVMIENSLDARPQSGLDQASVVFEAVAEGGVTRFMALFQDTQPDYIGPVRSARPYYIQWCMSFDCSYAHVGGSPDGLADIKSWGTKDLDQFANSGAYHRISSRYAPHNVYTSIANLNSLESSKGFGKSSFTGFSRKTEQPYKAPDPKATGAAAKKQDTRTPATSIDFTLSGYYYDPHFDYDVASNSYKRSEAGQPHMEQHQDGSQVQLAPKVVIGMVVPMSQGALDASGAYYSNYVAVGSGDAFVFQDGTVSKVHWSKSDIKSPLSFTDDAGKPFNLNAGQTWITAITDPSKASYK
ncbi:MAG TPA: DUF3048 domain-containing protein [Candidatus Microsaccharimonas sp.]|nr:DUF3048 domain-containing protein [Candidatus Microsaccharimonas sp.]